MESWTKDVNNDLKNVYIAAIIVLLYLMCSLGSFSPIFCRVAVAFSGALSIILSASAAFGILFYFDQKIGSLHASLPFLIIAVGVEHMYVICEAIDQI